METISITPKTVTLVAERGVICRNVLTPTSTSPSHPLRLTPTGKISHAKTRVYTQRYRKEWEQMSDFRGWLTSVSNQPTRAYCLYCRKNLHAHRLSLLKHTCTMKHQRSALTYQLDHKQIQKSDADAPEIGLIEEVETILDDSSQTEVGEDNDDDIEYVVERLDTDEDDSMELEDVKEKIEEVDMEQEEEKEMDSSGQSNEDSTSVIKKIKLLPEEKCQDPLTEAMAHVHNEYLEEEVGDQENVQVEMVIESTNNDISVLPELENDVQKTSKPRENKKTVIKATKNGKVLLEESKDNLLVTTSLPILSTAYQTNISTNIMPTKNAMNYVPIAPNPNTQKTITLMCGNKTFTLTGGTFQPGTQYVLTKLKGNPTALMLTDQNKVINESDNKIQVKADSNIDQSLIIPSTSQQPVNQQSADTKLTKKIISGKSSGKPVASKKLRISTYVVDNVKGVPINGLQVSLYKLMDGKWTFLNENSTNAEGQCDDLMEKIKGTIGRYKIHFDVDKYFTLKRIDTMFPFIEIVFDVKKPTTHYHIPLLLSPFGYTTYRGT